MFWINWVPCIGYSVAFFCHLIGLILLKTVKVAIVNQRIIIINLALSEMLSSCLQVVSSILALNQIRSKALLFFIATCGLVTKFIMLHLIMDRAIVVRFHLKYQIYFTKNRVKLVSFLLWFLSAFVSLGFILVAEIYLSYLKVNVIIIFTYLGIDSLIVISSVATYAYLFFVTVKSEKNLNGSCRKNTTKILSKYKVPCLITATYIVFNFTGMVLVVMVFLERRPNRPMLVMYSISVSLVIIGTISDCFIYVILQRNLRQYLCRMLKGRHGSHREKYRVSQTSMASNRQQTSMTTAL